MTKEEAIRAANMSKEELIDLALKIAANHFLDNAAQSQAIPTEKEYFLKMYHAMQALHD